MSDNALLPTGYFPQGEVAGFTAADRAILNAIQARTDLIGSAGVTFGGVVNTDGTLDLVAGDDYLIANGKQLSWRIETWAGPSLTGASISLALVAKSGYDAASLAAALSAEGSVSLEGQTAIFTAELTAEQTAQLETSPPEDYYNYVYQVRVVTAAGHRLTITTNSTHVEPGVE